MLSNLHQCTPYALTICHVAIVGLKRLRAGSRLSCHRRIRAIFSTVHCLYSRLYLCIAGWEDELQEDYTSKQESSDIQERVSLLSKNGRNRCFIMMLRALVESITSSTKQCHVILSWFQYPAAARYRSELWCDIAIAMRSYSGSSCPLRAYFKLHQPRCRYY